jgi:molybdate transport system substrate-binding protein
MKKSLFLFLFLIRTISAESFLVAIASNLEPLFEEAKKIYKPNLEIISGSSGKLTLQIKNGAPYSVFISADSDLTENLYLENLADKKPIPFADAYLVFISKANTKLKDIQNSKIIGIPNPETSPFGRAAKKILDEMKLESIEKKLIYVQSVSHGNHLYESNLVDSLFTSYSYTILKPEIQSEKIGKIRHSLLFLKSCLSEKENCSRFENFIHSKEFQKLLIKFGYESLLQNQ